MVLIFLFTSLTPTPVFAAELARKGWKDAGAVSGLVQGIGATVAATGQGFMDDVIDFFTDRDEEQAKEEAIEDQTLYTNEEAPVGDKVPTPVKEKELTDERDANTKVFKLKDGRLQKEVTASPIHYQDGQGNWKPIDPDVKATDSSGFVYANKSNTFQTFFGKTAERVLRFEEGKHQIDFGAVDGKDVQPEAKENRVTFPGLWSHADLLYDIGSDSLKETIRLQEAPDDPTYSFSLKLKGLVAKKQADGSIAFLSESKGRVVYTMPKPFMIDSQKDDESPHGYTTSEQVTQSLKQDGDQVTVTLKADRAWLHDEARKYPVHIDPTIEIAPTPAQSEDTYIDSGDPDDNYNHTWQMKVGTGRESKYRGLVKFDLSHVPDGVRLAEANLSLYYDQTHTTNNQDVPITVHRVQEAWDPDTVSWKKAGAGDNWKDGGAFDDTPITYRETVDNEDDNQTAAKGNWPLSDSVKGAYKGTYQPNGQGKLGATFTWVPHLKERGTYQVQVRYTAADDRATNAPYTIYHKGGKTVKKVNQQKNGGKWVTLGSWDFDAGSSHKIVLDDDANGYVIADAVRFVKVARAVKKKDTNNVWHQFPVTSVVQDWLDGSKPNDGFLIKSESDALEQGGPIYTASQHYDETNIRPKLTLIYEKPSVTVEEPTTLHGTGAELKWSKYKEDDFVEYQIHRSKEQQFLPDESTLIAPIEDRYQSMFTDTTAEPTPADFPTRVGDAYYYMVAVKTKDGKVHPSGTVIARLPKAGMTRVIRVGAEDDTTLSDEKTSSNLNHIEGEPNLMVGNNSGTYGNTRAVLDFDLTGIPKNANVVDAEMQLWAWYMYQSDPDAPMGTYQLHALNKSFTETRTNWKSPWSKDGGDYDSSVIDEEASITNDPRWRDFDVTGMVGDWVTGKKDANGLLLKQKKEKGVSERVLFLSSEARERSLRPRLEIIYTTPTADSTYHAPELPGDMVSGDEYEIDVTVTNTTDRVWKKGQQSLAYRWAGLDAPQGKERVDLPEDLSPGEVIRLKAKVHAPQLKGKGAYRETRSLEWDLIDHNGDWLSKNAHGIPALSQPIVVVKKEKADRLGEEADQGLIREETGGETELLVNLFEGNTMFDYTPFENPSKGFDTAPQMTYNSRDFSDSLIGPGWSFALTNMMRLGTPSTKEGVKLGLDGKVKSGKVTMVDGDGTQYTFRFDTKSKKFKSPKGTHLYLKLLSIKNKTRQWQITTKDGTRYYFDREGYISEMVDRNGRKQTYTYEKRRIDNHNVKLLRYLTDSENRRTVKLEYYSGKDANPHIRNQLKRLTDISGLKVEFAYDDDGRLTKITEGAGLKEEKVYQLSYEYNLIRTITDPRGHTTRVYYDDYGHMTKLYNREDKLTTVEYRSTADSDEQAVTIVTDPEGRKTATTFNDDGKPVEVVNAENEKTTFEWDDDLNLTKMTEPNGAVTTWTYDKHGNVLTETDAENNVLNDPADRKSTKMEYEYRLEGNVADLVKETSPEGRVTTYDYDEEGNLISSTEPKGNATSTARDFTTTYTYAKGGLLTSVKDAKGNVTKYGNYDANGSPQTITDAEGNVTKVEYGKRGEVLKVTDAEGHTSTYTYDHLLRPLTSKVPKEAEKGKYITIPAPVYDANDNVLVETSPNQAKVTYTYNKNDWVTSAVLPPDQTGGLERKVTYTYDDVGNLLKETEPKGNRTPEEADDYATKYVYDHLDRIRHVTNSQGHKVSYEYDNAGNLTKVTEPKGNETKDPDDYTTTYAYDKNHQATQETDTKGNTVTYTYDADGLITQVTDEEGHTTKAVYDENENLTEMHTPRDNGVVNVTRYVYDAVDNLTQTITPRGVATEQAGDYTEKTVYDKLNRVKEVHYPRDPNSDNPRYSKQDKLLYSYDKLGRITKISAPASEGQTVRNETAIDYFDNGWIKRTADPHNIQTTYDYNDLGQTIRRQLIGEDSSKDTRTQTWDYYPDGKLKAETDEGFAKASLVVDNTDRQHVEAKGDWNTSDSVDGHQGFDYLWNHSGTGDDVFTWNLAVPEDGDYDVYVKYLSHTDRATNAPYTVQYDGGTDIQKVNQKENGSQWVKLGTYGFRAGKRGKITLSDDANGTVVADAIRLVKHTEDKKERKAFRYTYDVNGNLTEVKNQSTGAKVDAYQMHYDGLNQVTRLEKIIQDQVKETIGYTYDANGNLTGRSHDGKQQTYTYTERNLLKMIEDKKSADDAKPRVWSYGYTKRGELDHQTQPNGTVTNFAYYQDGLLKKQTTHKKDQTLLNQHELKYNKNGHRIEEALELLDAKGKKVNSQIQYQYDPRDRLVSMTKTGDNPLTESVELDANSNIVRHTQNGATKHYTYDRNRMLTQTVDGKTKDYTYDSFGRLSTVTEGERLEEKNRYDGFDRLLEHTKRKKDGTLSRTSYTYDAFDRTLSKTGNVGTEKEETTTFQYLGMSDDVVSEEVAGKLTRSYTYAPWGERLSMTHHGKGETSYYGYNTRGDVEMLLDENGGVRGTYGYTMYGEDQASAFTGVDKPGSETMYNPYRYTAKRWDPNAESYDMGFRNYDPSIARFDTRDAYSDASQDLGLAMDLATGSRYAFAGGNPVSYSELDGHRPIMGSFYTTNTVRSAIRSAFRSVYKSPTMGYWKRTYKRAKKRAKRKAYQRRYRKRAYKKKAYKRHSYRKHSHKKRSYKKIKRSKPKAKPKPKPKAPRVTFSEAGHATLDVLGLIPGVGEFADGANAAWYSAEGDYANASLSAAAMIPFAGWGATGTKLGMKALPGMCFVAGTKVITDDGEKPIEEIKVGDKVLSKDEKTGKKSYKKVTRLYRRHVDTLYEVHAGGEKIKTTAEHPFWVQDKGWVKAKDLQKGDRLQAADGRQVRVDRVVQRKTKPIKVYNFEVEDYHTYFVSDAQVWVHNKCGKLPSRKAAFRQAKRDAGIPMSQAPYKVERPDMVDRNNRRILDKNHRPIVTRDYYFRKKGGDIIIQDHGAGHYYGQGGIGDQGPHFNVRPIEKPRRGKVGGTLAHYEW
ncbi:DNRLRE domain-containing protein [Salinithrix halophila]|uniref:DNRLRE domain-containing protein n=1 Tax=Salinithrix halophila TaxID=1485204 RepID=A0ABV8JFP6_9BACL